MKYVKSAISKKTLFYYILLVFLNILNSIMTLYPAEGMRLVTSAVENVNLTKLYFAALFILSMFIINEVLKYITNIIAIKTSERQSICIEDKFLDKIFKTEKIDLCKINNSDIILNMTNNIRNYIFYFIDMIQNLFFGYGLLIATVIYIFRLNVFLATIFIIYQIIVVGFNELMSRKIKTLTAKTIVNKQKSSSIILNYLNNFSVIKTLSSFNIFNNFRDTENSYVDSKIKLNKNIYLLENLALMISQIGQIIIVCGVGSFLVSKAKCSVDVIVAFLSCQFQIMRVVNALTRSFIAKETSIENFNMFKNIFSLSETDKFTVENENKFDTLNYKNVSINCYNKNIIKNSSISIKSGDKILLHGLNGKGKSTILKALLGLYNFDDGEILLNNCNFDYNKIKNLFVYIPQIPKLFYGTAKSNILLGNYNNIEKYNMIINKLNLSDIINKSENDFTYNSFSDGEKQRICIARALYNANINSIIVADEIFSCLDSINISRVVSLLVEEYSENTIIITTHQDIAIKFDKELIIEDNQIIQKNTQYVAGGSYEY